MPKEQHSSVETSAIEVRRADLGPAGSQWCWKVNDHQHVALSQHGAL